MIRILPSEVAPNGTTYLIGGHTLVVGCRPLTDREDWRREARWIVQNGLRDVLEWLGETPIPRHPTPGRRLLDDLIKAIRLQGGPADGSVHYVDASQRLPGYGTYHVAVPRHSSVLDMMRDAADATGPDAGRLYDVARYEQVWERRWGVVMPVVTSASEFLYRYTGD
jgi:hypothetical protein